MQRRWWIAGVAAVGVVLAVLLLPRPDTGADVRTPAPADAGSPAATDDGERPPGGVVNPRVKVRDIDPERVVQGTRPELEAIREARNRPEVLYASKVMGPWSATRYVLMKQSDDQAKVLADRINAEVMADLRKIRTADDPLSIWPEVEPKMEALATDISQSPWGSDETIVKSLERYRTTLQEFHDVQAGGTPPSPENPTAADPGEE